MYWMTCHFHFPASNIPHICSNLMLLSRPSVQVFCDFHLTSFRKFFGPSCIEFISWILCLYLISLLYFAEGHPLTGSWERTHQRQISKHFSKMYLLYIFPSIRILKTLLRVHRCVIKYVHLQWD